MDIRKRSLIIMISQGLTQATTIILSIILVRLVDKELFGTYKQVILVYTLISGVLSFQLNQSLFYFISRTDFEKQKPLMLQTWLLVFFNTLIMGMVIYLSAHWVSELFHNPRLEVPLRIVGLFPLADRFSQLVGPFMISKDRPIRAGIYTILFMAVRMIVVVTGLALDYPLTHVLGWMITAMAFFSLLGNLDVLRMCTSGAWAMDRSLWREQLHYVGPLWISTVAMVATIQFDKALISAVYGPEIFAVYVCGAFELPIVTLVTSSLSTAVLPSLVPLARSGRHQDVVNLWQQTMRKSSLVIFPCFAFCLLEARDLMVLLFGQAFARAAWPFSIYLLGLPIRIAFFSTLLRAYGRTVAVAEGVILGFLVNVVISVAMVHFWKASLWGFIGPSIGTVAGILVLSAAMLTRTVTLTHVSMVRLLCWRELARTLLLSLCCAGLALWIPMGIEHVGIRLAVRLTLFGIIWLVVFLGTGSLAEDEKKMIFQPMAYFRKADQGGCE